MEYMECSEIPIRVLQKNRNGCSSYHTIVTRELLRFKGKPISKMLEFGSGPTIIGVIGATPYVKEIHIADYLNTNLKEIRLWLRNSSKKPDFKNIIQYTLKLQGYTPTESQISRRESELRKKITKVFHCDADCKNPIAGKRMLYSLVISLYCADSATSSKRVWRKYMKNILSLVAPDGTIIMTALCKSKFYTVGDNIFPSANIGEKDLRKSFIQNGFLPKNMRIKVVKIPQEKSKGFASLLFACAKRKV